MLRGEVTCGTDEVETVPGPGTLAHVRRGTMHWYKFDKGGGERLAMTSRGNASQMYADFDREGA